MSDIKTIVILWIIAIYSNTSFAVDCLPLNGPVKSIIEEFAEMKEYFGEWIEYNKQPGGFVVFDEQSRQLEHRVAIYPDVFLEHRKDFYDDEGENIAYVKYYENGSIEETWDWDRNTNQSCQVWYNEDGSIDRKVIFSSYENKRVEDWYDGDGNLSEKIISLFENGKLIQEDTYDEIEYLIKRENFRYDSNDNQIEMKRYIKGKLYWSEICEYDSRNNLVTKVTFVLNVEGDYTQQTEKFTYDEQNNKIEQSWNGNRRYIWEYDSKGNLITEFDYTDTGELNTKKTWVYDETNRVIENSSYSNTGELHYKHEYTFDQYGYISKERYIFMIIDGNQEYLAIEDQNYQYDQFGNRLLYEIYQYGFGNDYIDKTKSEFEYDQYGNFTKETVYEWVTKFGKSYFEPRYVIYRKFEYFETAVDNFFLY